MRTSMTSVSIVFKRVFDSFLCGGETLPPPHGSRRLTVYSGYAECLVLFKLEIHCDRCANLDGFALLGARGCVLPLFDGLDCSVR